MAAGCTLVACLLTLSCCRRVAHQPREGHQHEG
jgi:hypothetical protein